MSVIGEFVGRAARYLRRSRAGDILYVFASLVISPSVLVYLTAASSVPLSCICHEQLLRDRLLTVEPREPRPHGPQPMADPPPIIITFYFRLRWPSAPPRAVVARPRHHSLRDEATIRFPFSPIPYCMYAQIKWQTP